MAVPIQVCKCGFVLNIRTIRILNGSPKQHVRIIRQNGGIRNGVRTMWWLVERNRFVAPVRFNSNVCNTRCITTKTLGFGVRPHQTNDGNCVKNKVLIVQCVPELSTRNLSLKTTTELTPGTVNMFVEAKLRALCVAKQKLITTGNGNGNKNRKT